MRPYSSGGAGPRPAKAEASAAGAEGAQARESGRGRISVLGGRKRGAVSDVHELGLHHIGGSTQYPRAGAADHNMGQLSTV